jgi:hypothetical protein
VSERARGLKDLCVDRHHAGQGGPMIGKLLGDTHVQTTARYTHLAADPVSLS